MNSLFKGKRIILGVTGSISAYKSPMLVRELIKFGAEVKVIMTPSACEFVTPLTLSNLSRNPVIIEMFDKNYQNEGAWHIKIVHWCDLMIIAPCSASTLGKIANGICDTALVALTMALPESTPLLIAPAMDTTMLMNNATQRNIENLRKNAAIIIPPEEGELSSGLIGPGRLPDTSVLLHHIESSLKLMKQTHKSDDDNQIKIDYSNSEEPFEIKLKRALETPIPSLDDSVAKDKISAELDLIELKLANERKTIAPYLSGKKVLITAGPTYEKIDDVRFISNHSSGKMGYALARQAQAAGANVVLVSGPVNLESPEGVELINVQTADEMFDAAVEEFKNSDISILAAAVADYTPISPVKGKIKKSEAGERLIIELQLTNDILASLGDIKRDNQKLVGFALESINEIENGWKKLKDKNCDMMVVNSTLLPNSGFGGNDNTITILTRDGKEEVFPPMSKDECSIVILNRISKIQG